MHALTHAHVQTPLLVFHQLVYLLATKAVRGTVHHPPISTCSYGKRSESFCVARFLHGDQYRETPLARTCKTNASQLARLLYFLQDVVFNIEFLCCAHVYA